LLGKCSWYLRNLGIRKFKKFLGQYAYGGCTVLAPNNTFNTGFNQAGGGVFAMEWDNEKFIRIWNFVQPNIPADIVQVSSSTRKIFDQQLQK
jgi:hypothetical protein